MGNQQVHRVLNENDVQMLVKTSGKSENEIREWYKEFHEETNGTDRMNKRQFQHYYTKLRDNPRLLEITDYLFHAFDLNNEGKSFLFYYFIVK